jgi:hypothetical protein
MTYWTSSSGRIELNLTPAQYSAGYHSGQCDADIGELMRDPEIFAQLVAVNPIHLREELREYGAWDDDDLASHAANLARLLWLACGDLVDQEAA